MQFAIRHKRVLPNVDEVLERLMNYYLFDFLEMNNVLYDFQFGFRQKNFNIPCFNLFN